MSGSLHPAIRHGIKIRLAPVPRRMKSHRKPQISSPPQREAEKEPDKRRRRQAGPLLAIVPQMNTPKTDGQHRSRRPKPYAARQRELRVPPQQKFLKQSNQ